MSDKQVETSACDLSRSLQQNNDSGAESQPAMNNKSVSFHRRVRYHRVLHRKEYTNEERQKTWYNRAEISAIEEQAILETKKNVSFRRKVVLHLSIHRNHYTEEERCNTWYTRMEMEQFKKAYKILSLYARVNQEDLEQYTCEEVDRIMAEMKEVLSRTQKVHMDLFKKRIDSNAPRRFGRRDSLDMNASTDQYASVNRRVSRRDSLDMNASTYHDTGIDQTDGSNSFHRRCSRRDSLDMNVSTYQNTGMAPADMSNTVNRRCSRRDSLDMNMGTYQNTGMSPADMSNTFNRRCSRRDSLDMNMGTYQNTEVDQTDSFHRRCSRRDSLDMKYSTYQDAGMDQKNVANTFTRRCSRRDSLDMKYSTYQNAGVDQTNVANTFSRRPSRRDSLDLKACASHDCDEYVESLKANMIESLKAHVKKSSDRTKKSYGHHRTPESKALRKRVRRLMQEISTSNPLKLPALRKTVTAVSA